MTLLLSKLLPGLWTQVEVKGRWPRSSYSFVKLCLLGKGRKDEKSWAEWVFSMKCQKQCWKTYWFFWQWQYTPALNTLLFLSNNWKFRDCSSGIVACPWCFLGCFSKQKYLVSNSYKFLKCICSWPMKMLCDSQETPPGEGDALILAWRWTCYP